MGFHLLSSFSGFLPLAPSSSSSSGVGIPGMEVKARARCAKYVWGSDRGRTRKCRGGEAVMSLCKTSGRSDGMVIQGETTNSRERQQFWGMCFELDRRNGWRLEKDRHNGLCLAMPRSCLPYFVLLLDCGNECLFGQQILGPFIARKRIVSSSDMLSHAAQGQISKTLLAHKWVSYIRGTCEGLAEAPTSTEEVAEVLCGLAFARQRFGSLHLDSQTAARVAYN